MLKSMRWEDEDAIIHDSLRIHKRDDVMCLIAGDVVCTRVESKSRIAWRIFMKFVMDVMPFQTNLRS
jgi:hypothetical protein